MYMLMPVLFFMDIADVISFRSLTCFRCVSTPMNSLAAVLKALQLQEAIPAQPPRFGFGVSGARVSTLTPFIFNPFVQTPCTNAAMSSPFCTYLTAMLACTL